MAVKKKDLDGRQFYQNDVGLEEVDNDVIYNKGLMLEDEVYGEEDETIENFFSDNENISQKDNDNDVD